MGIDGLSVSNLGLYKGTTPAEVAFHAELGSQQQAKTTIKKIDEADSSKLKTDKEDDEKTNYEGRENEEDQQEPQENHEEIILQEKEDVKRYKVKLNQFNDMVELIDKRTGNVVETITPNDLINLVSKSNDPAGVLVDREI